MKVSAWSNGKDHYGIRVGKPNRRQYFDPQWKEAIVTIDGSQHAFSLTKGFWKDCPEFRDKGEPIVREWLASQDLLKWPPGKPPKFILSHISGNRFELRLA